MLKEIKEKRLHLMVIYSIIFVFSIYAIFQLRYFLTTGELSETDGRFKVFFFGSENLSHHEFIMVKLSLFVITGILSYVLLMSNYFMYKHPKLEDRIVDRTRRQMKEEMKKSS